MMYYSKDDNFDEINKRIETLINQGLVNPYIGKVKKAKPIKIEGVNKHACIHGITLEQAQGFVNTSKIMFDQGNRCMYLSNDGSASIIIENRRLISAYGREHFDLAIKAILEVLNNV